MEGSTSDVSVPAVAVMIAENRDIVPQVLTVVEAAILRYRTFTSLSNS